MRCLCCGKALPENAAAGENAGGWHKRCVRKFFGTDRLPELELSAEVLRRIAEETTKRGFTVPGVQKKLLLHLTAEGRERPRLTLVGYPTGYILKPQTERWPALPEAEYLVMRMAQETGIRTVPFALLRLRNSEAEPAYITKRIDRKLIGKQEPVCYAMEDFCQLDLRLTEDKYRGSYERCAKVIERYSVQRGLDMSELFLRLVFSFCVGNSDMHLKNFSLIETGPGSGQYQLSAAYDLLPVSVILPEDPDQMALSLNGKKRNLHRNDFLKYADAVGIRREAAVKMLARVISMKERYFQLCEESLLPDSMKERLRGLIADRTAALEEKGGHDAGQ